MAGVRTASMACPMECPKLTRLRRPVISRSSAETMWALTEIEPVMMLRRVCWAGERVERVRPEWERERVWTAAKISAERDSREANSDSSQMAAVYSVR
jgi:hypothetical protein